MIEVAEIDCPLLLCGILRPHLVRSSCRVRALSFLSG